MHLGLVHRTCWIKQTSLAQDRKGLQESWCRPRCSGKVGFVFNEEQHLEEKDLLTRIGRLERSLSSRRKAEDWNQPGKTKRL